VERWQPAETSSFHMSCGEMTFKLDVVKELRHLQ
ncbi:hypothetical protein A2U01_0079359, partial [Trifolium medium]|nr:hypothetical protein [Trifolium medium]